MRERQPIDPKLPHDFPLEPGSGTPRARPIASAAERIAASEAALGTAKPGGANHPGQTNFIAAARRAAQAAAAAAPEAPRAAKPLAGPAGLTLASRRRRKSPPDRSVSACACCSSAPAPSSWYWRGGKLVLDMFDIGSHSTANIAAPIFTDVVDEPEAPKPQAPRSP